MKIEDMGLSTRSATALRRAGITTAEELAATSKEDLCRIRNLGMKSYKEINTKLEELGYERYNRE